MPRFEDLATEGQALVEVGGSVVGVDIATQAELDAHTTDATDAHDASAVSITDAGAYFTGTDVETALQELGASGGGSGPNGARIRRTTNQAIANATTTAVSFDTEVADDGAYWAIGNPTRLTIAETGTYLIGAIIRFESVTAAGRYLCYFTLNVGGAQATSAAEVYAVAGAYPSIQPFTRLSLTAGDYLELKVAQYSGASQNLLAGDIEAWIEKL